MNISAPFLAVKKWLMAPLMVAKQILDQPSRAFPVVDFLKGLSVLMVILFHIFFAVFFLFKDDSEKLNGFVNSIPEWFSFVLGFDKAVDIFFLLSAFLLSYALFKVWDKKQDIHIRRFYLHRFFRIYPLFLVALLIYGLGDIEKLLTEGWYSLLFIENIFSKAIIPVQWSLSIEMQFYLVLPFLLLFLAKSKRPILWLSLLILASIGSRFYHAWQEPLIYQTHWYQLFNTDAGAVYMDTMYYLIENRITPLLLGVLWALLLWKYPKPFIKLTQGHQILIWLFGFTVIYWSLRFPVYHQDTIFYQQFDTNLNLFMVVVHRILFSFAVLGLVLFAYYRISTIEDGIARLKTQIVECKIWRLLSEVAYPMYFFHFPFIVIAWVMVLGTTDVKQITEVPLYLVAPTFILALLMTLYFSLWMHHAIEKRFIKIGKTIEKKWFDHIKHDA
jgi:peptidoglycan/LPS O-acetylase OafA/YrhL